MSASHSQLCVGVGPVGGVLCVCLLGEVRVPDPGKVSQFHSVEVSWKDGAYFQDSSANRSHCANLLREERLIKTRRTLDGES